MFSDSIWCRSKNIDPLCISLVHQYLNISNSSLADQFKDKYQLQKPMWSWQRCCLSSNNGERLGGKLNTFSSAEPYEDQESNGKYWGYWDSGKGNGKKLRFSFSQDDVSTAIYWLELLNLESMLLYSLSHMNRASYKIEGLKVHIFRFNLVQG